MRHQLVLLRRRRGSGHIYSLVPLLPPQEHNGVPKNPTPWTRTLTTTRKAQLLLEICWKKFKMTMIKASRSNLSPIRRPIKQKKRRSRCRCRCRTLHQWNGGLVKDSKRCATNDRSECPNTTKWPLAFLSRPLALSSDESSANSFVFTSFSQIVFFLHGFLTCYCQAVFGSKETLPSLGDSAPPTGTKGRQKPKKR